MEFVRTAHIEAVSLLPTPLGVCSQWVYAPIHMHTHVRTHTTAYVDIHAPAHRHVDLDTQVIK